MPSPTSPSLLSTDYMILGQRQQYRHCHLQLPEESLPIAGVRFQQELYSFFRVVPNLDRARQLADRLADRNHRAIITLAPKGYVIWVYEAKARLASHLGDTRQKNSNNTLSNRISIGEFPVLRSERDYQSCKIQVPDLDKPLTGITHDRQFYSLLRMVRDESQASELAHKLQNKGNQALITESSYGYSVWVLEPEGRSA